MERNVKKSSAEVNEKDSGRAAETPRTNGASASSPSVAQQPRPEIAVLGWDARSYRLSLRENKF